MPTPSPHPHDLPDDPAAGPSDDQPVPTEPAPGEPEHTGEAPDHADSDVADDDPADDAVADDAADDDHTPEDEAQPVQRHNKWKLLGITAGGLILAVLLGWFGGILAGKAFGPEPPPPVATTTSAAPTTPSGSGDQPGQPIKVTAATLFDPPPGDGAENPDRINLSYDGLPGTTWPTLQYKSTPQFGNLKPGVGIIYDLGSERTVSKVDITTTLPGAVVEIRSGTGTTGTIDQFPVIGGPVTLQTNTPVALPEGTTTRYVLVWITQLVPQQGYFQASLSEVAFIS